MKKPKTSVVSFTAYDTETKKKTTNCQTWASQLTNDDKTITIIKPKTFIEYVVSYYLTPL